MGTKLAVWSLLWLCPDWTVSSTATLANVPSLCGRAGAGVSPEKAFTPPYSRGDDIPSMAEIYVFARVCILPLSLPPTHGEKSQPTFYFRHSFTLALPLDCCSFSPFLFFFISSATYGLRPLFVCSRPLLGPLSFSVSIYRGVWNTKRTSTYINIRNPKRWIPRPPVRRVWQM